MGPLAGLKVIDLTHVMAGPTCTMMLADMGADVIKIERNPGGDDTRRSVPPKIRGESAAFMMMNRNKRGLVLDLKTEGGAEVLRRLAVKADVLVENFGPGVMERLGFGYENLKQANPGLIYCSLSGFGRTGPYKDRRGFDLVAQAMSGIMSVTGDGPDSPPAKCAPPLSDITAGIIAAMGVLAAYAHRLKTGKGQWLETSLFEAALVQTYWQSAIALATGVAPRAMGSAHPLNAPYQAFEAADGWIVIGGANQRNWLKIVDALGAPELASDPRFAPQSGAHGQSEGARSRARQALSPEARRALAGCAGRARGAGRSGQRHAAGVVRPADHRPRDGGRARPPDRRAREGDRIPGQVLRYPRQGAQGRAGVRRGHVPRSWPSTASAPMKSRRSRRRAPWSPTARRSTGRRSPECSCPFPIASC